MKKLVIAAGTGFLGEVLVNYFKKEYEIIVLTRNKTHLKNQIQYIQWDAKTLTGWEEALENTHVLINLAGKSVDCRYNDKNKAAILSSRIDSTKILNEAILKCKNPPIHFINSSTATIYRFSLDKQMDEYTGEIGNDFSMNVAKNWEKTFYETQTPKTLKTTIRTSIVLGRNGGAFVPLKRLAQMGFGGKQGKGNQLISWIHEIDFARAIEHIIDSELLGNVNVVSPNPIGNQEFMKQLRETVKMPIGIPINEFLLKIGAKIIGTETELVLKSRNVIPKRLLETGFKFQYKTVKETFEDLINKPVGCNY
jgi:uncharacterized protein